MYGIDFVRLDYRISKWNNFMIHVGSGLLKLGFIASRVSNLVVVDADDTN